MSRTLKAVIGLGLLILSSQAQTERQEPIQTTLCEIMQRANEFNGKLVKFRATVISGFEASLLRDESCSASIWFEGVPVTHLAIGTPRTAGLPIKLIQDMNYWKFREYLQAEYKPKDNRTICQDCPLYAVYATVVGRFDHIELLPGESLADRFRRTGSLGYGHLGGNDSQLTLQQVSEVTAVPVDSSKYESKR